MPHNWEHCFLLHARSFGDTSIIADVFTESSGKISIMAKGAKNPRSKFFGHLLPFSALRIIVTGKSEMKTLTQIDSNFVSQSVKGPHDLYTYLYVNELMMRLLPKGLPNQELFNLYQNFVELARADAISELDLRAFELDLLDVLGYGINFDTDSKENTEFKDSIIYSCGIAKDISFDEEISKKFNCDVFMFDPTEESKKFMISVENPRLKFFNIGIWKYNGNIKFYYQRICR